MGSLFPHSGDVAVAVAVNVECAVAWFTACRASLPDCIPRSLCGLELVGDRVTGCGSGRRVQLLGRAARRHRRTPGRGCCGRGVCTNPGRTGARRGSVNRPPDEKRIKIGRHARPSRASATAPLRAEVCKTGAGAGSSAGADTERKRRWSSHEWAGDEAAWRRLAETDAGGRRRAGAHRRRYNKLDCRDNSQAL